MGSHRHRVDNGRAVWPVEDDEFEEVRGLVRAENEVSVGVLADLVDGEGLGEGVLDVLRVDAVA